VYPIRRLPIIELIKCYLVYNNNNLIKNNLIKKNGGDVAKREVAFVHYGPIARLRVCFFTFANDAAEACAIS